MDWIIFRAFWIPFGLSCAARMAVCSSRLDTLPAGAPPEPGDSFDPPPKTRLKNPCPIAAPVFASVARLGRARQRD
jgi:hypothetical protein